MPTIFLDPSVYPLMSSNGVCIGPCHNPGKTIMHPNGKKFKISDTNYYCPTLKKNNKYFGKCNKHYANDSYSSSYNLYALPLPKPIALTPKNIARAFLKTEYGIFSKKEFKNFMKNHMYDAETKLKLRILGIQAKYY